jgi:predicted permease
MESSGYSSRPYFGNGVGKSKMNTFGDRNLLTDLQSRLRALFRRNTVDRELDDELCFHLEQQVQKLVQSGVPETEARRQAHLVFGGAEQIKEVCREARGTHLLETFLQDLRYAGRMLRKSPGFTVTVILTLALGIGATTAMFSVVQGVMLAPLPYPEPDRLVLIWQSNPHAPHVSMSLPDYRDWQQSAHSFDAISGIRWENFDLTNPGIPEHFYGYETTPGFFSMLGVHPILGREFSADEDRPGGPAVAMISDREWQNRFGRGKDVLGKTLTMNSVSYTIIGVLPPFRLATDVDVFIPLGQGEAFFNNRRFPGVLCIARLKHGVSIPQAQAEMTAIQQNIDAAYPDTDRGLGTDVVSLKSVIVGDSSTTLLLMLGAVAAVLLVACANVANLLLARSAARAREFTIRSALGAARSRIIRQLLTESVVLSLIGGAVGLAIAKLGMTAVMALLSGNLRRTENIGINGTVLLFAFAISILVGILFGLAPAFRSMAINLQQALKQGARGSTGFHHRTQNALVIGQMALTLVLLAGASLLFRTIHDLWKADPGFQPQNVVTFKLGLPFSPQQKATEVRAIYKGILDRIRAIPGVESVDSTMLVPLNRMNNLAPFWIGSHATTPVAEAPRVLTYWTGSSYLDAMGIPLLQGRYFTDQDSADSANVIVIDNVMAKKYFDGKDPVGEFITISLWGTARVIGVVGHVRHAGLGDPAALTQPQAYAPLSQFPVSAVPALYSGLTVVARTRLQTSSLLPQLQAAISGPNGGDPIYDLATMRDIMADSMTEQRFPMVLLSAFAGFALLLASLGTYAVISYSMTQRTAEIGIRMALGAQRSSVFRMVLREGSHLAIIGVLIGTVATLILGRALSSFSHLLYGVRAQDPIILCAVSLILMGASLIACYLPARRATRTDPMMALRHE